MHNWYRDPRFAAARLALANTQVSLILYQQLGYEKNLELVGALIRVFFDEKEAQSALAELRRLVERRCNPVGQVSFANKQHWSMSALHDAQLARVCALAEVVLGDLGVSVREE